MPDVVADEVVGLAFDGQLDQRFVFRIVRLVKGVKL
jgi:hypothetical protein